MAPNYEQSRLSLPAICIRSLCGHAQFRLSTIDKKTREEIGVSTYVFEKNTDNGQRYEAVTEARRCLPETNERRDDDGVLAGWLASGFDGLIG